MQTHSHAEPFDRAGFNLKEGIMAYTPELAYENSCTLRRIAWALGMPMTKAINHILEHLGKALDARKVCERCRDKTRCEGCAFNRKDQDNEAA